MINQSKILIKSVKNIYKSQNYVFLILYIRMSYTYITQNNIYIINYTIINLHYSYNSFKYIIIRYNIFNYKL